MAKKQTFNQAYPHALQLEQIQLHDPAAYAQITEQITKALTRIATRLRPQPVAQANYIDDLADLLPLFEASLDQAPAPGKEKRIATTPYGPISIHRLKDRDHLRLIIRTKNVPIISKPLARWSFDEINISGRAGRWKLVEEAERLFEEWSRKVEG